MPVQKICGGCGKSYWGTQEWIHQGCLATNRIATNADATNVNGDERPKRSSTGRGVVPVVEVDGPTPAGIVGGVYGVRTANRRSREVYNAYQREYMRKRRAKEVG